MQRTVILSALATLAVAAGLIVGQTSAGAEPPPGPHGQPEPPMLGIHYARGVAGGAKAGSQQLIYHNGPIITDSSEVRAIFWGAGWSNPADKMTAVNDFYSGVSGTPYMKTNTEYTDSSGRFVSAVVHNLGSVTDLSAAPTKAPSTSTILAEVQRQITNPVPNGYYPVYVDAKRGSAGYCAWHSWGSVTNSLGQSVPVQFGFFFNLDGDSGCNAGNVNSYSQGAQALVNVSGHEISEMVTDARGSAWYDRQGAENADKCAWTFNGTVAVGSTSWNIQQNWSNAKAGCIQTTP